MRPAACTATLAPMSARNRAQVRLRIDFDAGASIGPGKVALLEQIDHCGSLSQAARDLGLSYRRAWNLLDDLNHAFAEPVVATVTGGARGGGARITALGRQIVERYRRVEKLTEAAVDRQFKVLVAVSPSTGQRADSLRRPLARPLKSR